MVTIKQHNRESCYELLRLISQVLIIVYHIFSHYISKMSDDSLYKAIQMPLHAGVIVFVLLSGFFSIRPSSKKLIKLLSIFLVYSLPEIIDSLVNYVSLQQVIYSLFILSSTHFWFIKTYLFLFLVSPLLNYYWDNASEKQKNYLTAVLGFVAMYMAMTHGDKNMVDGKNLVNFMFIYYVGRTLSMYKYKWESVRVVNYLIPFAILNILIVIGYIYGWETLRKIIWRFSFPYSSPILLLDSVLLFLVIAKWKFKSRIVNYMAESSLAIYLIHGNRLSLAKIGIASSFLFKTTHSELVLCMEVLCFSLLIMITCIIVDKLLQPIWNRTIKFGNNVYNRLGY